jgi:glycosyltransferase involved in cell wall biosynthesis
LPELQLGLSDNAIFAARCEEPAVKVFLAGTSLLPTYGGPAFSVSRLATALTEKGVEVGLWAPDQSAPATPLLPDKSAVRRLTGSEAEALDGFGGADVLHDNGIWLPHNHRLAKFAAKHSLPRLVSTRGMLEPWPMSHKQLKKTVAWWLYQRSDLKQARCLHATAETEARNLQRLKLDVPICMIPNGMDVPEARPNLERSELDKRNRGGRKTALFLGRIYPVKGLPMLIEAWAQVRPPGWTLQIAGPDEAGHRAEVERAVSAANLTEVVSFIGPVDGEIKQTIFFDADLFVLPTHSESFGMVVAEALAHGLPVLTTTGAPWPILSERECGWRVAATVEGITEGLRLATSQDVKKLKMMGAKGRELIVAEFGWAKVAKQFIATYECLAGRNL